MVYLVNMGSFATDLRRVDPSTWSQRVMDCSKAGQIEVVPFDLKLGYDYWDYSMQVSCTALPFQSPAKICQVK